MWLMTPLCCASSHHRFLCRYWFDFASFSEWPFYTDSIDMFGFSWFWSIDRCFFHRRYIFRRYFTIPPPVMVSSQIWFFLYSPSIHRPIYDISPNRRVSYTSSSFIYFFAIYIVSFHFLSAHTRLPRRAYISQLRRFILILHAWR